MSVIPQRRPNAGRQSAFTIVELLIVIVVIGILATIAFNSFADTQRRARNAQTISLVKAYRKALMAYATDKRTYPTNNGACLGNGYADTNSDGVGDCAIDNNGAAVSKDPAFDTAIKPYIGDLGQARPNIYVRTNGQGLAGAAFYASLTETTLDGAPHQWYILYMLEGSGQKCDAGPTLSVGGYPALSSTPPFLGYSETWAPTATVRCWMAMPNPSSL